MELDTYGWEREIKVEVKRNHSTIKFSKPISRILNGKAVLIFRNRKFSKAFGTFWTVVRNFQADVSERKMVSPLSVELDGTDANGTYQLVSLCILTCGYMLTI